MESLAGLSGLRSLGSLGLHDTALTHLTEPSGITTLGALAVSDSPDLVDFGGLGALTSLGHLSATNLPSLRNLDALSGVTSMKRLELEQVPSLASLSPLAGVAALDAVVLRATGVSDLRGLERVTVLSDGMILSRNADLVTLDGAGALVDAGSFLGIDDNPRLESVRGLAAIERVSILDVQRNTRLSTCEVEWLAAAVGKAGEEAAWRNGGERNCRAGTDPELPAGVTWFHHYDDSTEVFTDVALFADGSFVVQGQLGDGRGDYYDFVTTYSAAGAPSWTRLLAGPDPAAPIGTQGTGCLEVGAGESVVVIVDELEPHEEAGAIHTFTADGVPVRAVRDGSDPVGSHPCAASGAALYYGIDSPMLAAGPARLRKRVGDVTEWTLSLDAPPARDERQAVVAVIETPPGVTVFTGKGGGTRVTRVTADGVVAWRRDLDLPAPMDVSLGEGGSTLLSGQVRGTVDAGGGPMAPPRSGDEFAYLCWLAPDGTFESLRFIDGEAWVPPRTAVGEGDAIYFMIGVPRRPFVFEPPTAPGASAPGVTFAKLDRSGRLLRAIDVTAVIEPWTVDGIPQMSSSQPVVASDGVVLVSTLLSGGIAFKFEK